MFSATTAIICMWSEQSNGFIRSMNHRFFFSKARTNTTICFRLPDLLCFGSMSNDLLIIIFSHFAKLQHQIKSAAHFKIMAFVCISLLLFNVSFIDPIVNFNNLNPVFKFTFPFIALMRENNPAIALGCAGYTDMLDGKPVFILSDPSYVCTYVKSTSHLTNHAVFMFQKNCNPEKYIVLRNIFLS